MDITRTKILILITFVIISSIIFFINPIFAQTCADEGGTCKATCAYGEKSIGSAGDHGCSYTQICCVKDPSIKTCADEGGTCKATCASGEKSIGKYDCSYMETCCIKEGTKPDLLVTDISWTPNSPKVGDEVKFKVKIKNTGGDTAYYPPTKIKISSIGYEKVKTGLKIESGKTVTYDFTAHPAKFSSSGNYEVIAIADYIDNIDESNENNNYRTETLTVSSAGANCPDGTKNSQCSLTKPKYCDNGNLVNKPSICGCPLRYTDCDLTDSNGCEVNLNTDNNNCGSCGNACESNQVCISGTCQTRKCSDSTQYGQCSTTKPKYCDNGNLVNKCDVCGCPSEETCQNDGSCMQTGKCTPGNCDYPNRRYCLADETWSSQDSQDYCNQCNHCGDGACNCNENQASCQDDCGAVGKKPVAIAGPDRRALEGVTITLDGTKSYDPDGTIVSYKWTENSKVLSNQAKFSSTFPAGTHHIKLTITDNDGYEDLDEMILTVLSVKPNEIKALIDFPKDKESFKENEIIYFAGSGVKGNVELSSFEWRSNIDGIIGTEGSFYKKLSQGNHKITLTVFDDNGNSASDNVEITVGVSKPLTARITSPTYISSFTEGDSIFFDCSVTGGKPPYIYNWKYLDTESREGDIDMGNTKSFTRNEFPVGWIQVSLTVIDALGSSSTDFVSILITRPLTAFIISPTDGEMFVFLDKIHFEAKGSGGKKPYSYAWTSDIDGYFGYDSRKIDVFDDLSEGTHNITLTIFDDAGNTATDSITITTLHTSTSVAIISPSEGDIFGEGDTITFDSLVHGITPYTYSWTSDIDGNIGNSQSFSRNDLSAGHHTITLTITDGAGSIATKSIGIIVADATFDWRNKDGKDWMTSVKNQLSSDCWAHSMVGVMEAKYNIQRNNPNLDIDLSEQYLVSCRPSGNAFSFVKNNGITSEDCFPYRGSDTIPCPDKCVDGTNKKLWKISSYGKVSGREAMKEALVNKGPLSASIFMSGEFVGNVYRCEGQMRRDHMVIITGYSDTGNYWIVKNSWGDNWNDDGYFNVGYGECGMEKRVTYYIDEVVPPK